MVDQQSDFPAKMFERSRELQDSGLTPSHAHGIAWLEERIRQWPSGWGDNLEILIYGDFEPLTEPLSVPSLRITVHPEKLKNTIVRAEMTVHKATVGVEDKSVESLINAARRINVLLGSFTLVEWGNVPSGWWSWVIHGAGSGLSGTLAHKDLIPAVDGILALPDAARKKVDAALFWIREPRNSFLQLYRSDLLRVYSAYWNSFECLVEAVEVLRPRPKLGKSEKKGAVEALLHECGGQVSPEFVQRAYLEVVNPGFVFKAQHALQVCFGDSASHYMNECFRLPERRDRLYDIRNAINHGDVDAENPSELVRIEARLHKLWMIIWRMFGRLVPFPAPLDPDLMPKDAKV